MNFMTLLASFGGGVFGAALGGLPIFVFTGLAVLLGAAAILGGSSFDFISNVAFGPVFGPHVAFCGGVAAVAYAAKRVPTERAKISSPVGRVSGIPQRYWSEGYLAY